MPFQGRNAALHVDTVFGNLPGVASANQHDPLHGHVNMQGSIIDTPCAIATADLEQTVDMAITTTGEIVDDGKGKPKPFSLTLINCVFNTSKSDGQRFMTTFDGPTDDGLFSINGAQGVGLQIADIAGNIAILARRYLRAHWHQAHSVWITHCV